MTYRDTPHSRAVDARRRARKAELAEYEAEGCSPKAEAAVRWLEHTGAPATLNERAGETVYTIEGRTILAARFQPGEGLQGFDVLDVHEPAATRLLGYVQLTPEHAVRGYSGVFPARFRAYTVTGDPVRAAETLEDACTALVLR